MISADQFLDNGDGTVLVVHDDYTPPFIATIDRPCDACNGDAIIGIKDYPSTQPIDCPDCDGTGRHTFVEIEVAHPDRPQEWPCPHRTLRAHVLDVLPIVQLLVPGRPWEAGCVLMTRHKDTGEPLTLFVKVGESVADITLPSAAKPGMRLVRLAVHQ